jgi:short-subunit dehydrogenase
VFDFNELCRIEDYKTKIGDALKDIDIGMLFLNAGYGQCGPFADITNMDVQKICNVNAL